MHEYQSKKTALVMAESASCWLTGAVASTDYTA